MPFKAGDLFLAKVPDGSTVAHLCIAVTDEDGFPLSLFIVPIMTPKEGTDRTVMLPTTACPEFLQYESCIVYDDFHQIEVEKLSSIIVRRYLIPLSAELLDKVIDGIFRSDRTKRGAR